MTKQSRYILKFVVFTLACFSCDAADFELWTQGGVIVDITESSRFLVTAGVRWNQNASRPHHGYGEVGILFNINDKWLVIPSYRESIVRGDTGWEPNENPRFTVIRRWDRKLVRFSNRSRFEYRSRADHFLYRNRAQIEFKLPCLEKVVPYIADEIFLDKFKNYSQNRLSCGFHTLWNDRLSGKFGYMFRWRKGQGTWTGNHVLQYYLSAHF